MVHSVWAGINPVPTWPVNECFVRVGFACARIGWRHLEIAHRSATKISNLPIRSDYSEFVRSVPGWRVVVIRLASSTARMPVKKIPSKVPAPPIEATGAPRPWI